MAYVIHEVLDQFRNLESRNINELLLNRDIKIYYCPFVFTNDQSRDAVILTFEDQTAIFLRLLPDENPLYEQFLLWHEFGHYVVDGKSEHTRSFDYYTHNKADEVPANVFAVLGLLDPENPTGEDIYTAARRTGIPSEILVNVLFRFGLDSDPEVSEYYLAYQ